VVGYKYERMRQKEETNLVVVFEVEVGTGELDLDDPPEPVHWRTKRDVRGMGRPVPAVKRATNLPRASTIIDPETPPLENGPELS
jgi:hypothetical protein